MLDELESGPWPSFVTGLKRLRDAERQAIRPDDERPARPARALLRGAR